jgi:uncharacterized protein (DUF2461 family)
VPRLLEESKLTAAPRTFDSDREVLDFTKHSRHVISMPTEAATIPRVLHFAVASTKGPVEAIQGGAV